jgi:hypothetical protein
VLNILKKYSSPAYAATNSLNIVLNISVSLTMSVNTLEVVELYYVNFVQLNSHTYGAYMS